MSNEQEVQPQPAATPAPNDRWSLWFSRLVQIGGLATFAEQVIVNGGNRPDRPWILLIALAMMLGGFGLQLVLRALLRLGGTE